MAINCDTSPTTFAYGVKATSPVFPPVNVFWPRLKVPHNVVMHTIVAVKAQVEQWAGAVVHCCSLLVLGALIEGS